MLHACQKDKLRDFSSRRQDRQEAQIGGFHLVRLVELR